MDNSQLEKFLQLGKRCAVDITGIPEDADDVTTFEDAMAAITCALKLGKDANNELNKLRMESAQR